MRHGEDFAEAPPRSVRGEPASLTAGGPSSLSAWSERAHGRIVPGCRCSATGTRGRSQEGLRTDRGSPRVDRLSALLRRWLLGTHQGTVENQHLDCHVDEFIFRFHCRTSRSRGLPFYRLVEQAVATAPGRRMTRTLRHCYDVTMISARRLGRSALSNMDLLDAVRSRDLIAFDRHGSDSKQPSPGRLDWFSRRTCVPRLNEITEPCRHDRQRCPAFQLSSRTAAPFQNLDLLNPTI